jgi:hypothetical protein
MGRMWAQVSKMSKNHTQMSSEEIDVDSEQYDGTAFIGFLSGTYHFECLNGHRQPFGRRVAGSRRKRTLASG